MTAAQARQLFQERVVPQLREMGVEAAAISGYLSDGNGEMVRFSFGIGNGDEAADKGLKPVHAISALWAAGEL